MDSEFLPYIRVKTVDDLIRASYQALLKHGSLTVPSKGEAIEISGISFELTNPRARLSQSSTRGRLVSALGELCWYLSGEDSGRIMDYYLPSYSQNSADDPDSPLCTINGAYGPRIFGSPPNQFEMVKEILSRKPFSRQAVIQIFDSKDVSTYHRDVPCTCTLQFLVREEKLSLIVYMRSNDAYLGLPHDIFCFTMLQEMMANSLGKEMGTYRHFVGSFHLYTKDLENARKLLDEGWYSTSACMPPMPRENLERGIGTLLESEKRIRGAGEINQDFGDADVYWMDLIKVLQAHRADKDGKHRQFEDILQTITNPFYTPYLVSRVGK